MTSKTSKENLEFSKELKKLVKQVTELESALYEILDADKLDAAKEIAAEALGEDLDIYNEKDVLEMFDGADGDIFYGDEE